MIRTLGRMLAALSMVCFALWSYGAEAHKQRLAHYVVPDAPITGELSSERVLHLAIGLEPRDEAGLQALARVVADPKSSQFRHFLTLDELTARFSPTAADYEALIQWAEANKLTVEARYPHRLLLGVSGRPADVERALAVKLSVARRVDGTEFYKPDRVPSIDLDVKISQIAGIDNLFVPRHHGGSLLGGSAYGSADLRHAYVDRCQGLTGAGEAVGIMSYYTYAPGDITNYETATSIAHTLACGASVPGSAPCINNDVISTPTSTDSLGTAETTADIEMALALAPGMSQIEVFQADPSTGCTGGDDIVSAWLATPSVHSFSSSISFCLSDDVDTLAMMGAAGQSAFISSGDDGTGYTSGDGQYFNGLLQLELTPVGGTILSMHGAGVSFDSEQSWFFSGGGVEETPGFPGTCTPGCTPGTAGCSNFCIPPYQVGVATAANGASNTYRNDPDIAMPSQGVFVQIGGTPGTYCGTSASAPEMAGFMVLADQEQCALWPSTCARGLGFVSPALYAIGLNTATEATSYHDVIGNASMASSCVAISGATNSAAPAVSGYDLATGWGSPKCGLVAQLSCTFCTGTTPSMGTLPSTSCVNFQADANNCGSCGNVCSTGNVCSQGQCVPAGSVGDTHLTTFDGLYYDFQASGEFVLAKADDFEVQTRQASGAPMWPDAAVNKAVATRMGKTTVALCEEPMRLEIDGKPEKIADGETRSAGDGVRVKRDGDVYTIRRRDGESVQATLNPGWINVAVDLGSGPHGTVSGLLGNADGSTADDIWPREAADPLPQPVSFDELYKRYGRSWQVEPDKSLLCGDRKDEYKIPAQFFYANDLTLKLQREGKETCGAAGVKNAALLDACVLDNAVLANKAAARAFVGVPAPIAVMKPVRDTDK